jgi:hypothetical protein
MQQEKAKANEDRKIAILEAKYAAEVKKAEEAAEKKLEQEKRKAEQVHAKAREAAEKREKRRQDAELTKKAREETRKFTAEVRKELAEKKKKLWRKKWKQRSLQLNKRRPRDKHIELLKYISIEHREIFMFQMIRLHLSLGKPKRSTCLMSSELPRKMCSVKLHGRLCNAGSKEWILV